MRGHFLRAAAGNGGEPPWTPAEITTALWLKADDASTITETSGDVSQWNDKSGNGRNFTATGATQPTYTAAGLNGKAVLDFAGDYLTSASAASTWKFLHDATGSSVFVVAKAGVTSDPNVVQGLMGTHGAGPAVGFSIYADDRLTVPANDRILHLIFGSSGDVWNISADDFFPSNQYGVIGVIGNPSASQGNRSDRSEIYANGVTPPQQNNDRIPYTLSNNNPAFTLQIGARGNNNLPLTGGIAEVVIVSGIISEANRDRMFGYLAHEWGRTSLLPSDHPYKNSRPTI